MIVHCVTSDTQQERIWGSSYTTCVIEGYNKEKEDGKKDDEDDEDEPEEKRITRIKNRDEWETAGKRKLISFLKLKNWKKIVLEGTK